MSYGQVTRMTEIIEMFEVSWPFLIFLPNY